MNDEKSDTVEDSTSQSCGEERLLSRLETLLQNDDNRWEIGDILNQLRKEYEWTFLALAERFDYSRARLIQFASVATAFQPDQRTVDVPFVIYEYTRSGAERVAREVELHTGTPQEPDYVADLQYIAERRQAGDRLSDQRGITAALAKRAKVRMEALAAPALVVNQARNAASLGVMHNRPCQDVLAELADGSVNLIHLDPPFANYRRDADGHLDMSTSTAMTSCDNYRISEAVEVTVASIRAGVPKLMANGVILLWQASTMPRGEIAQVVDELDLGGVPFLIWNKHRPKLGDAVEAVQYSTEVCFVLCRRGEKPLCHDHSLSKLQVIDDIPPLTFSAASIEDHHQMEKPVTLLERILKQFTRAGDTVVDGFGCSASCSVAAINLDRRWVYIESHPINFKLGERNIMAAQQDTEKVA